MMCKHLYFSISLCYHWLKNRIAYILIYCFDDIRYQSLEFNVRKKSPNHPFLWKSNKLNELHNDNCLMIIILSVQRQKKTFFTKLFGANCSKHTGIPPVGILIFKSISIAPKTPSETHLFDTSTRWGKIFCEFVRNKKLVVYICRLLLGSG